MTACTERAFLDATFEGFGSKEILAITENGAHELTASAGVINCPERRTPQPWRYPNGARVGRVQGADIDPQESTEMIDRVQEAMYLYLVSMRKRG